jgi:hypothetical protein
VSPLFRRPPLVRAEIALHGPRRAAARLHPGPGRWPELERADRLSMGLAMAALAARAAPPPRWNAYRDVLARFALGLSRAAPGPLPGDLVPLDAFGPGGLLAVVPWEGPGRLNVEAAIVRSAAGPVPKMLEQPDESGPAREVAALALLVALAADAGEDRLALALGVEGLLSWHRESDRSAPARDAFAFSLLHAAERLRESGRELPPGA